MLHISYGDINSSTQYNEENLREHFSSSMSQGFIDTLCQKNSEKAKRESICAYLNLANLLDTQGIDTKSLNLKRTPDGKPYFDNSSISFSISHTDKYFAVAISDSEVGIDIESKDLRKDKQNSISKRFFLPSETEYACDRDSFLRVWTFKEAYAKMKGLPLSRVINKASVFDDSINKIYKTYNEAVICICLK